jgi:hypothetical protein
MFFDGLALGCLIGTLVYTDNTVYTVSMRGI